MLSEENSVSSLMMAWVDKVGVRKRMGGPGAFMFWPRTLERSCCLRPKKIRTWVHKQQEGGLRGLIGRTDCATQPDSQQGKPQGTDGASAQGYE